MGTLSELVHISTQTYVLKPHSILLLQPTFWNTKGRHDSFNQAQNIERTAAHIGQEKHDANAATKLWTQGSTDHI